MPSSRLSMVELALDPPGDCPSEQDASLSPMPDRREGRAPARPSCARQAVAGAGIPAGRPWTGMHVTTHRRRIGLLLDHARRTPRDGRAGARPSRRLPVGTGCIPVPHARPPGGSSASSTIMRTPGGGRRRHSGGQTMDRHACHDASAEDRTPARPCASLASRWSSWCSTLPATARRNRMHPCPPCQTAGRVERQLDHHAHARRWPAQAFRRADHGGQTMDRHACHDASAEDRTPARPCASHASRWSSWRSTLPARAG